MKGGDWKERDIEMWGAWNRETHSKIFIEFWKAQFAIDINMNMIWQGRLDTSGHEGNSDFELSGDHTEFSLCPSHSGNFAIHNFNYSIMPMSLPWLALLKDSGGAWKSPEVAAAFLSFITPIEQRHSAHLSNRAKALRLRLDGASIDSGSKSGIE